MEIYLLEFLHSSFHWNLKCIYMETQTTKIYLYVVAAVLTFEKQFFFLCGIMFPYTLDFKSVAFWKFFLCSQWQHSVHKNHIYPPVILAANRIVLEVADDLFYDILIGVSVF